MQHARVKRLCISFLFLAALEASAETGENFNSRAGVPIKNVKAALQNACWTFHHFDVNDGGWNPAIEGDGAMVSGEGATRFNSSGIYTPVLSIGSGLDVSFEYVFNEAFTPDTKRWIRLCLTDANNNLVQVLENIELEGEHVQLKKKYEATFKNILQGEYRLVLQYGGTGGNARIAIDKLSISAPLKYPGGCNTAPAVANGKLTGMPDRTAAGSLLAFNKDRQTAQHKVYLIKDSPDGSVQLENDGTFIFIPHKGFEGKLTSFVYKVCNDGSPALCSENKTAFISFPESPGIASTLIGLKGWYRKDGHVELSWATSKINNIGRYNIQRSFDGQSWENAGTVEAVDAYNGHEYTKVDKLFRSTVLKKDLYYRLKQTDVDGSVSYSRLLVLRVYNTKTITMMGITPDPAKNDIAVNMQLQQDSYVSMRVLNSSGSCVIYKSIEVGRGERNLLVDGTSKLEPGLYMLELIVNSKERMLVKLVKE